MVSGIRRNHEGDSQSIFQMNKKALSMQFIVITAILLIVLVVFAISWKGGWDKVTEKAEKLFRIVVPGRAPLEEMSEHIAPEDVQKEFDTLCEKLEDYKESKNCLIKYTAFTDLRYFIEIKETLMNT